MPREFPHHLRFRQVHLDFHTSGDIPGVGSKFDRKQFQDALKRGHVDSITVFSKCHHGWSYHPTAVGQIHPTLDRDLLSEQIEACREIDVRCPIYLSAGIDELAAKLHPEWVVVDRAGNSGNPLTASWKRLRFNSPYLDYLCAQIEEVVQRWPDNDGIFLDIIHAVPDYSRPALHAIKELGLDASDPEQVAQYAQFALLEYYKRTTASAKSVRADTPVFHNGGHIPVGAHEFNSFNTHFELESLPTGGWGYDHFPLSARYAITQPRDFLGMTGKFHNTWGEFGGFKRPAALRYECAAMIAQGAKCSVGDQLHPSGEMNLDTYELIGAAYREVEQKEAWTDSVVAAAKIAIVCSDSNQDRARGGRHDSVADEGAARMLLELHLPFVVLDESAPWTPYEVVVLTEAFRFSDEKLKQASAFLAGGGKIIAAGSALLSDNLNEFVLDPGANVIGRSPFDPEYLVATSLAPDVPVRSSIVIKGGASALHLTTGKVLAERREPYFNRTWEHFCSHQHTPDSDAPASPAAVVGNGIAYFAHNLFGQYRVEGQPLYRDFFHAALRNLLPGGLPVETSLPSVARFNLLEQPDQERFVAHLLYAPITLRAMTPLWGAPIPIEIVEELIPLHEIDVSIQLPRPIRSVSLAPSGESLPFRQEDGRVHFRVDAFTGHQMVVLSYGE